MLLCYEKEFVSPAGDSGLTFFGSMSAIENSSMMNNVGINISQLCISLRILRHKIGAKFFEPESRFTYLGGGIIIPQFGEYKFVYEIGSKPDLFILGSLFRFNI